MAIQKRKACTIYKKVLIPLGMVAFLYVLIMFLLLNLTGVFSDLRTNALDMLDERTQNKQQTFRDYVEGRWSNLDALSEQTLAVISEQLEAHAAAPEDIRKSAALNAEIAKAAAPILMKNLFVTGATGAFLILDGPGTDGQHDSYSGVYLRDLSPSSISADNADIVLVRGLPAVSRELRLSLDSWWKGSFSKAESERFFRPLEAARNGVVARASDYGVWTPAFQMDAQNPTTVITYSEPLIDGQGNTLGVVGVELSTQYLASILSSGESSRSEPGCFVLAMSADGADYLCSVTAGTLFGIHFNPGQTHIAAEGWEDANTLYLTGSRSGNTLYGSVYPLSLYDEDSPFAQEKWVLLGLQSASSTMSFTNSFIMLLIISGVIALMLGLVVAAVTSKSITTPITRLVARLQEAKPDEEIKLPSTGVKEIDIMVAAIIEQSHNAADQAQRLASILSVTGTSVGVYELRSDSEKAYCSRGVYQLFDIPVDEYKSTEVSRFDLRRMLENTLKDEVDDGVWRVHTSTGIRYLRHRQLRQSGSLFGALTDVTTEMENRYRIEHERDYDVLTNLLNRRAFARYGAELFDATPEKLKTAAVVMMDLDNLKYMNDTYGHDCGDNYIKAFADALTIFEGPRSICGRRSGDEFYVLLYGWDSREALEKYIHDCWDEVISTRFRTPGDQITRLRASGGIAWYPEHSDDFQTLVRYADIAMYKVKQSSKGILGTFDATLYERDVKLLNYRDELNRMLDERLVKYAFQPIVSARTGELLGYELLMRPTLPQLSNPQDALDLAKQQGVLHHMERLTWMCALETAEQVIQAGQLPPDCKLFINSIANQIMTPVEEELVVERYGDLLPRMVLELTESENNNREYTNRKQEFIRSHGGVVAIDDYGTGYNSELILIQMPCEYVKLDISFVRDVDTNVDKQAIVRNLMTYAHRKGIFVLCEGVETESELAKLISYDVDYIQGYYVGRPSFTPLPVAPEIRQTITTLAQTTSSVPISLCSCP